MFVSKEAYIPTRKDHVHTCLALSYAQAPSHKCMPAVMLTMIHRSGLMINKTSSEASTCPHVTRRRWEEEEQKASHGTGA